MLGRSWAVQRNQDKSPGAAKPLAVERVGETPAEHPNPQLPGAAVTARPPGEPGVGAAGVLGSWEAVTPDPTGGPRAPAEARAGLAERREVRRVPAVPQPPPMLAGHSVGGGEHEQFPRCDWSWSVLFCYTLYGLNPGSATL